jgi:NADPH:quinone reductase
MVARTKLSITEMIAGKRKLCELQKGKVLVRTNLPIYAHGIVLIILLDVVYDPVGLVQKSLKIIAWKGRVLVVGFAAGTIEKESSP